GEVTLGEPGNEMSLLIANRHTGVDQRGVKCDRLVILLLDAGILSSWSGLSGGLGNSQLRCNQGYTADQDCAFHIAPVHFISPKPRRGESPGRRSHRLRRSKRRAVTEGRAGLTHPTCRRRSVCRFLRRCPCRSSVAEPSGWTYQGRGVALV